MRPPSPPITAPVPCLYLYPSCSLFPSILCRHQLKKKWDPFRSQEPPYAEYNFIPRLASYHMGSDAAMLGPTSTDRLKAVMVRLSATFFSQLSLFDHRNPLFRAMHAGVLRDVMWVSVAGRRKWRRATTARSPPSHASSSHRSFHTPFHTLDPLTFHVLVCSTLPLPDHRWGTDTCADVCVCVV